LPLLGSVGGATVNMIFMDHFQRIAQGHFALRRLERAYGSANVRRRYNELIARKPALFIAASAGERQWSWLVCLRAFAETGMIRACADWLAVAALFRRPLGLPIPHTACVDVSDASLV
jgi:Protein of unknown function (DUF445)